METIKSYTDISQSKKLAEILPLESADMFYLKREINDTFIEVPIIKPKGTIERVTLCAWSLAALLEILSKIASKIDDDGSADLSSFMGKWYVNMFGCPVGATDNYDNTVDACYEMILKLYELKMLLL